MGRCAPWPRECARRPQSSARASNPSPSSTPSCTAAARSTHSPRSPRSPNTIAANYDLYLAATVVVETAERLTADAHDGTHSQYLLLLGALNALARGRHDPTLIRTSYTLRALALAGWAPSCFDCAVCGTQGPHTSFSIPDGGTVCDTCRPPGASSPAPDTVALLGQLLSGDWERADRCEPYARTEASGLISSYTQWHLERRLRSLSVIDRSHP